MAAAETGGVGLVQAEQSLAEQESAASPKSGSGSENPAADLGDGGQLEKDCPESSASASENTNEGSNPQSESASLAVPESAEINAGGVDNSALDLGDEDGKVDITSPPKSASSSQKMTSPPRTAASVKSTEHVKAAAFDFAFKPEEQVGSIL